jgi:hypothetical protein
VGIPSADAKALIIAAGVGASDPTVDWGVHLSFMPAAPLRAIAIHDTGGTGEGPNPKWLLDYRTIQVMTRAEENGYVAAYQKLADIKDVLLGMNAQVVASGDRWDGVTGLGDITSLARTSERHPLVVMNFRIIVEPLTNSLTSREPL